MTEFLQDVVSGLGFGAIYALAALGLVFIFKTTSVVNFASGVMGMAVAMILWSALNQAGLPLVGAWLLALVGALLIGVVTETVFLRRIEGSPLLIQIVLTLGLLLFIRGVAGRIWGYDQKTVPKLSNADPTPLGSLYINANDLLIVVLTVALAIVFYVVFERTRVGLAMQAVSQDREVAALMGIRVFRFVTASWAIGVLVTGVAAILVAPTVSLSPTMMDNIAVYAFAAAVLGGFGSLAGAVVGGFLVGVISSLVGAYLSTNYELSIIFLLIVVVLYVRPQGLFGVEAKTRQ
jgi:branched-chain amino acid transport system permease protein